MSPSLNSLPGKSIYYKIRSFLDQWKQVGPHTRKKIIFEMGHENFFKVKRYMERYRRDQQDGDYTYLKVSVPDPYYDGWRIYLCNSPTLDNDTVVIDGGLMARLNPNGLERAQFRAKRPR